MNEARRGWFLVLTGWGLSLIVFGLALFAHNSLRHNDLGRASQLGEEVRTRLSAAPVAPAPGQPAPDADDFVGILRERGDSRSVETGVFYEELELARLGREPVGRPGASEAALHAPLGLAARYEGRAVSLRWMPDLATIALSRALPSQHSLAYRVYRGERPEPPQLLETVPFDRTRWRDGDLPLFGTELSYQVWTVLLRHDPAQPDRPVLVDAQRSDLVTAAVPEDFRLELVTGSPQQAIIRVEVGPASRPAVHELAVVPGETLVVGDRSTGLVLDALEMTQEERLVTRHRLVFTSDASLVIDPATGQPRTSATQVLMPVARLTATLRDRSGASRTLELDLP